MKRTLLRILFVGVPGTCFLTAGIVTKEYPAAGLGCALVIGCVYELGRKSPVNRDRKQRRRSFALAGVIGASFAISGFGSHEYWLGAAGTVIFIGALLRLYGRTLLGMSQRALSMML
jgi:hypothetical protein